MNATKSWSYTSQTLTLLFIMFIDGVGMSLVLPLSADLFSRGDFSLLSNTSPDWLNQFYYGANLASFSIAMIFGASILGQLSDKYGRKLILNLSLLGALTGYLICAVAVISKVASLFIIGRVIDGLTAGSIPVAQAILTDIDTRTSQMTSIGRVMFAVTSGYMFGPIIAGSAYIGHNQNHYIPFLLIAFSYLGSMAFVSFIKESKSTLSKPKKLNIFIALRQLIELFKIASLRSALFSFFLFQCAWTLFYQYLPKIQIDAIELDHQKINFLMAAVGAAMCFAFCVAVPKLKLPPLKLIILCFGLFTIFNFSLFAPALNYGAFFLITVCMALIYAIGYSAILGFILAISSDSEKGLILGSVASMCAVSASLTAILGGYLNALSNFVFFSVLLLMSATALMIFLNLSRAQALKTI